MREEPIATTYQGDFSNPDVDLTWDVGNQCFITGNRGQSSSFDDVDNGLTRLTSPEMALANYNEAMLRFHYWFFNAGGNVEPDDALIVMATNGITTDTIMIITESESSWSDPIEILLNDYISINRRDANYFSDFRSII